MQRTRDGTHRYRHTDAHGRTHTALEGYPGSPAGVRQTGVPVEPLLTPARGPPLLCFRPLRPNSPRARRLQAQRLCVFSSISSLAASCSPGQRGEPGWPKRRPHLHSVLRQNQQSCVPVEQPAPCLPPTLHPIARHRNVRPSHQRTRRSEPTVCTVCSRTRSASTLLHPEVLWELLLALSTFKAP